MFVSEFYYGLRDTALNLCSKNFSGSKLHKSRSPQTRQCGAFELPQSGLAVQLRVDRSVEYKDTDTESEKLYDCLFLSGFKPFATVNN